MFPFGSRPRTPYGTDYRRADRLRESGELADYETRPVTRSRTNTVVYGVILLALLVVVSAIIVRLL